MRGARCEAPRIVPPRPLAAPHSRPTVPFPLCPFLFFVRRDAERPILDRRGRHGHGVGSVDVRTHKPARMQACTREESVAGWALTGAFVFFCLLSLLCWMAE